MTVVGFHSSHEQLHPAALLDAVQHAERAGFTAAMSSDHFAPWSSRQGESAFAWSWLGAALQATRLPFGIVNAPGQRYHPAIIAQAAATLSAMYPGRFWVALGSGEASNEHITGDGWPRKPIRDARLRECVDVIRALLAGEEVSHDGLVRVDRARLWTLRDVLDAYRDNGGRGPVAVQVHLCYAADEAEALKIAHEQWRTNVFSPPLCWDLETPAAFDEAAKHVPAEAMRDAVQIATDPDRHTERLREIVALGVDELYLHHVGQQQGVFIEVFGERVLTALAE
jgi:alkanesulfonate monooxygenase SsuD/methylene tetrahydromethanopterin reductase-like flavin-dependent oxidoreductase (luciferase family)